MFLWQLDIPVEVTKLLVVESGEGLVNGYLLAFSRCNDGAWSLDLPVIKVALGKAGTTLDKKEGDNKTPIGLFPLGVAFGKDLKPKYLNYQYQQLNSEDKFIDDPLHQDYNKWVTGNTDAKSYEVMLREDGLYDLGIVIQYNIDPVIPGKGSAIFIHIWRGRGKGTEGCIAMSRSDLEKVLNWINADSKPHIYITTQSI